METWSHTVMKSKGSLRCFFFLPTDSLSFSLQVSEGFKKAKVCGRASSAKAILS